MLRSARDKRRDPEPPGEELTLDIGTPEKRESTQRGLAAIGSDNPNYEKRPKIGEDLTTYSSTRDLPWILRTEEEHRA